MNDANTGTPSLPPELQEAMTHAAACTCAACIKLTGIAQPTTF